MRVNARKSSYGMKQSINRSINLQERKNSSWHPSAETNEFEPMPLAESNTISIELVPVPPNRLRRYCHHRCDDQYLEVWLSSRARRDGEGHDGPPSNKAEHLHAANTSTRRICWYIALVRTSDSSARDTQTETTSAPPESGWTVTTISLWQRRWTTFPSD